MPHFWNENLLTDELGILEQPATVRKRLGLAGEKDRGIHFTAGGAEDGGGEREQKRSQ